MYKARRENVPATANSLEGLANTIIYYEPILPFFRGKITAADDSVGLIFMHNSMIEPLSQCTQLYADGTFKAYIFCINNILLKFDISFYYRSFFS